MMVEIAGRSQNAAFIASAGVRRGARALSEVSQAAGREVDLTQSNLRPQSNKLSGLGARVGQMALAINGIEEARGIIRSQELSEALKRATQRAVTRLLQAESLSNSLAGSRPLGLTGTSSIADVVGQLANAEGPGNAVVRALSRSLQGGLAKKPTPISIIATAAAAGQSKGDIFERQAPVRIEAQGRATVEITRRALEARVTNIAIDPADAEAVLPTARVADAGASRRDNEGFVVTARAGDKGGTIAIDMTDETGDDSRLSTIDVQGGDGSDVIFLSGANNSTVRAGDGNDYVMADGDADVYGGNGDDILIANIVFGEEGDDVLFGNALAVGGNGNDRITMFSLADGEDGEAAADGLAFGGDGDDIIVGEARISADGGAGNDAITLRVGGFANGGDGNDTLTAFDEATLEGGAGDDDILMLGAGTVDGGDGKDDITATFYSTVTGGKGDDLVRMNTGGMYRFAKGDGQDRVLIGSTLTGQVSDWGKTNRIELSGFNRDDVDIFVSSNDIAIVSRDPNVRDRISITRALPGDAIDIVFTKDNQTQTLSVTRDGETLGQISPVIS